MIQITFIIFGMGIITVVLSLLAAYKFNLFHNVLKGASKNLSKAIAWQLLGEAVIGFGTLAFSFAAYTGRLEHWSIETQSAIRFFMFFATAATTLHLYSVLKK